MYNSQIASSFSHTPQQEFVLSMANEIVLLEAFFNICISLRYATVIVIIVIQIPEDPERIFFEFNEANTLSFTIIF